MDYPITTIFHQQSLIQFQAARRSVLSDTKRTITWSSDCQNDIFSLLNREWLITNGLGGYSSGTLAGALTRRYHALLVAALDAPYGRTAFLNNLLERIDFLNGTHFYLGAEQPIDEQIIVHCAPHLAEFSLINGIPTWKFNINDTVIEKKILMPHLQNTVMISYTAVKAPAPVTINLRPFIHIRPHNAPFGASLIKHYLLTADGCKYEIYGDSKLPHLKLLLGGNNSRLILDGGTTQEIMHVIEAERGYDALSSLWTPGFFSANLSDGESVTLTASCEPWDTVMAITPEQALELESARKHDLIKKTDTSLHKGLPAELILAADQFIVSTSGRKTDSVCSHTAGDEPRSIIAGYHWFTDWGRDTMISLEGLTLVTKRFTEARWIIRTFSRYIRNGLLPNLFPEGENDGLYHTADATLWFFHAAYRYFSYTNDMETVEYLLPVLINIFNHHVEGTLYGIGIDNEDGLLRQGQNGYQLTWMDAKVEDWVVTPRDGKAVEINALWYNCIKILEKWISELKGTEASKPYSNLADKVFQSFNNKFWYNDGGYLYDVIDGKKGNNKDCRPNQIFSFSLDYPVLEPNKWSDVLYVVQQKLLTPFGLRSLAPGHIDYKPRYFGDLRARDAAYHQGTVWAWLIGPFIDAWLKVHDGDKLGARKFLEAFDNHLSDACVGSISEIFDAEKPFAPRGCIAQAWSVAEILRSFYKTS